MRTLAALFSSTILLCAEPSLRERDLPPPTILADEPAAKIVDRMTFRNDRAVVPIEAHRISAHFPDESTRPLLQYRSNFGSSARASVSPQGHIAVCGAGSVHTELSQEALAHAGKEGFRSTGNHGLVVFKSPAYKPTNITKIRKDRHAPHLPELGEFTIEDTAWGDGFLACAGCYVIHEVQKGPPGRAFQVRFISRILIDASGNLRDHQILWSSLQPEHLKGEDFPDFPGSGHTPVPHTLHVQGDRIFWRNLGDPESPPTPDDDATSIKHCLWRSTSVRTGLTEALRKDSPADREKLTRVDADLEKRLEAPSRDFFSRRHVTFLKEALQNNRP